MTQKALEQYLNYMHGLPQVESVHQVAVTGVSNSQQQAIPANDATYTAVHETPEEHAAHEEAMQVVHHHLQELLAGNNGMRLSPDVLMAFISDAMRDVDNYKKERAAGGCPVTALSRLNTNMSHSMRKHKTQHNKQAEHENCSPQCKISGHSAEHHGCVEQHKHEAALEHHFGQSA